MAEIIIEKGGMLTTIQDSGRHGYQRFGMPVSGAMDHLSLQIANTLVGNTCDEPSLVGNTSDEPSLGGNTCSEPSLVGNTSDEPPLVGNPCDEPSLVGNPCDEPSLVGNTCDGTPLASNTPLICSNHNPGAAALEATLVGPEILFVGASEAASASFSSPALFCTTIAITGADMQPCINGKPIQMYTPIKVMSGDRLTFLGLKTGCRTYIAFAGGLNVPLVMGSRSTYLRAKIGGLEGRPLKAGDVIPLGSFTNLAGKNSFPKITGIIPDYQTNRPIRIIPGPEISRLDFEGVRTFLTTEYTVSTNSDRMGLRLDGQPIHIKGAEGHDIISSGISFGTIQLPGNGLPIILMADRQTTGGYARIANVLTEDLPRVAQLKPGDKINFASV